MISKDATVHFSWRFLEDAASQKPIVTTGNVIRSDVWLRHLVDHREVVTNYLLRMVCMSSRSMPKRRPRLRSDFRLTAPTTLSAEVNHQSGCEIVSRDLIG
jgi:hypothetical protein